MKNLAHCASLHSLVKIAPSKSGIKHLTLTLDHDSKRFTGSQFTSFAWPDRLKQVGARISMDGKGRCLNNIFIERLWRSRKYECVSLHAWATRITGQGGRGALEDHLL